METEETLSGKHLCNMFLLELLATFVRHGCFEECFESEEDPPIQGGESPKKEEPRPTGSQI